MALYSLFVEHGGKYLPTQVTAPSVELALEQYFDVLYPKTARDFWGESAPMIGSKDIILITPMDPLINMWLCQAALAGAYVTVICARTVAEHES